MNKRYLRSVEHLKRAEKTIPLGSQTFSKSRVQYPIGISPLYISNAKGSKVWDIDGNEYTDLVNSLASVTLGYGDKGVQKAVKKQLKKGVNFSLPGILEAEVAELIVSMVPSAEMVRFGKNGTDATSAAIRLSRAFTARDRIAVCGYHGWQDWFIGSTTRNKGVPMAVSSLTHKFEYNKIESLKTILAKFPNQFAAVILEPMNIEWPSNNFLEEVKKETQKAGAILIFDETITGFRFNNGGAQTLFNVIPDLSTFGKGMANGFPLSAVVGRRDLMMEMEEIFFSGTFGGELLSLAAAKEVLSRYKNNNICEKLEFNGQKIQNEVNKIITENHLQHVLALKGHPSWNFLSWSSTEQNSDLEIKTFFMQEMFKIGILILGTHNISTAHNAKSRQKIIRSYDSVLRLVKEVLENDSLRSRLEVIPLKPLFKVR
jgi:glutamate-1-semialdehyde 2,1-aminomutase